MTVAPYNSEQWNYEWKRLYVGTIPAKFLSLTIDNGTMTMSVYNFTFYVVYHLTVNHGTMTGRGYLWVLLQLFFIEL